jgi:hypothetical protein
MVFGLTQFHMDEYAGAAALFTDVEKRAELVFE